MPSAPHTAVPRPSKVDVLAAASLVLVNRALLRTRLRKRIDGWRRAVGLVLRTEASSFILSAFGLDPWSRAARPATPSLEATRVRVAERLHQFLHADPSCHIRVRTGEHEDRAEPAGGPCYTLAFEPWVDGPARFVPPQTWTSPDAATIGTPAGCAPLFNIVARIKPGAGAGETGGEADLWFRVNHVGTDGVPVQELLNRLEASWGVRTPVHFPTPEEFEALAVARPVPGRTGLAMIQSFHDFGPLLAWRKRENARLPEPMTVAAALQWRLAQHPALAPLHMGSTVEVAPAHGLAAGVGVVVVRPADYAQSGGLASYVRAFNQQVELNRVRASSGCKTLDAAAHLPARLARALLRYALQSDPRAFGYGALTVLKDARVFGAPIAEVGHEHGFIALGSLALPTAGGGRVGCVTVKGPSAAIGEYPALIGAALRD